MFLSEIFDQLSYGELSSLSMGGVDCTGIEAKDYPRVVAHVNMALTALHTRFPIKIQEVVIKQYDQIQIYYMDRRFAVTNTDSDEPIKYIDDSKYYPFEDNVLSIHEVFNEDGQTLFLDDGGQHWSVFAPSHNSIQVPWPDKENSLIVSYRANHPTIQTDGLRPETEHVDLPPALLEPLLFYVGSRAFSNLNSDQVNEGNNYMAKYEASCRKIEELGLITKDSNINTKLDEAHWV